MSSTFCPMPWNSINIRNNGDIRICCNANSYTENKGIVRMDDGTPYNIGKHEIDDARNAELLKEVRLKMLDGEWHPECERCRQEEINGIKSRREHEVLEWGEYSGDFDVDAARAVTNEDGSIDTNSQPIEFFDIRYGNFCNLKCRMCGPTESHTWFNDYVKLHGRNQFNDTHGTVVLEKNSKGRWETDSYNWFKQSNWFWNQFEKHTHNTKRMYIVGGEPLIIDEHLELLERLVANGNSHNIEIEYNSNLTNVTKNIVKLWEKFKQIRIGASIDGYGDVFNYQRSPANWDKVYNNMLKLENNKNINLKGWFTYTVTPLNLFHLPEFMRWKLEDSGLSKFNPLSTAKPIVTYHMCHAPKHYNVKILPPEYKKKVSETFTEYKDWIELSDYEQKIKTNFVDILNKVERFMNSEDYSEHLQTFIDTTLRLDKIRNQNIFNIVPEFGDMFYAYNQ